MKRRKVRKFKKKEKIRGRRVSETGVYYEIIKVRERRNKIIKRYVSAKKRGNNGHKNKKKGKK